MSSFKNILILFISVVLSSVVITTLFSFFGIGFDIYGNYLLWFIALAILYAILPKDTGFTFNKLTA
jgi:hypothetical protein